MALPGDPSYASPSPPAEQATETNAGATSEISQPLNSAGAHGVLPKRGGWITFPFLAVNILGTSLAAGGATANFIVYLIKVFNCNSIEAAKINNVFLGSINLTAVVGAMLSDAFFGRFPVIVFSSIISLLSTTLFTLTAAVPSFHPPPCSADGGGGSHCQLASAKQLALLYSAMALLAVATGGARFNTITMGAEQFDRADDQEAFFNWYFFIVYVSLIIGSTAIVYVEDNLSWQLGFGICTALSAVSLTVLISGLRFYRRQKARGSPFTGLARVVVAAVRKRKIPVGSSEENYYSGVKFHGQTPSRSLRFLNQAALIADGDLRPDGSNARPWRLATVEQVEDLKALLRLLPLWSSSVFISVPLGVQLSLSVLQALAMDRSLGPHFSFPAGSIVVSNLAAVAISIPIIDRLVVPLYRRLSSGAVPSPIHRIGTGHVFNILGMAASAMVVPLAVSGVGEALHFPGQVSLYHGEFPRSLKGTAAGMVALVIGVGYYLSTAVVDLVREATAWLPESNNINEGRMDYVFWMLTVVGSVNFVYYLVCATLYKCRHVDEREEDEFNPNLASL